FPSRWCWRAAAGPPAERSPPSGGRTVPRRSGASATETCFEDIRAMAQPPRFPRSPVLTIVDHPLVRHKLSLMRKQDTSTSKFRALMREISLLLAYEATRDLALEDTLIETPLEA